mmetsp:Transcript_19214/g.46370  ORF Transcript_19214/g.46370 Transcript_19214/m.46370 type:complete len:109 (+) Transcript_19214:802-1128(+)
MNGNVIPSNWQDQTLVRGKERESDSFHCVSKPHRTLSAAAVTFSPSAVWLLRDLAAHQAVISDWWGDQDAEEEKQQKGGRKSTPRDALWARKSPHEHNQKRTSVTGIN